MIKVLHFNSNIELFKHSTNNIFLQAKDAQPQWETMVAVHKIEYEKEEDANKAIQVVETCKKSGLYFHIL